MTDAAISPEARLSAAGAVVERFAPPPRATLAGLLSAAAWRSRAIEVPEPLLGELVVSTTRMFVGGPTGLGKTHLGFAMAAGMKDEEPWTETMPLVKELTRRRIAQVWFDHMGHNTEHIYGSKTKEWQIDVVAILKAVEAADADLSFRIEFPKARRREKSNRADFEPVTVTLKEAVWEGSVVDGRPDRREVERRLRDDASLLLRDLRNLACDVELTTPEPGMPRVRAVPRSRLRKTLIASGWFTEAELRSSVPEVWNASEAVTRAAQRREGKALDLLKIKGLAGRNRDWAWPV